MELRAVEDDAIREVVKMQEDVGLQAATDASSAVPRGTWTSSTSWIDRFEHRIYRGLASGLACARTSTIDSRSRRTAP